MKEHNAQAFARVFTWMLLQFREAIERRERSSANIHYAAAIALVSGATLSGGMKKSKAQRLLLSLDEARTSFITAFGDSPTVPVIEGMTDE